MRDTSLRFATLMAGLAALALPLASAGAQEKEKSTEEIVTQPVRDVGLEKTKIPPLLVQTAQAPYSNSGAATCSQISSSIAALSNIIGPDFSDSPAKNKDNLAKTGGEAVVNSLIPFRGLIREASGASAAERRKNAAIDAGYARRGYLRGLQRAKGCKR